MRQSVIAVAVAVVALPAVPKAKVTVDEHWKCSNPADSVAAAAAAMSFLGCFLERQRLDGYYYDDKNTMAEEEEEEEELSVVQPAAVGTSSLTVVAPSSTEVVEVGVVVEADASSPVHLTTSSWFLIALPMARGVYRYPLPASIIADVAWMQWR